MKKVLIAIDYSPLAQQVAEQGHALALAFGAKATILHVIDDAYNYTTTVYDPIMGFAGFSQRDYDATIQIDTIEEEAMVYLHKIKLYLKDTTLETLIIKGSIAETILDTAKNTNSDYIVMGTNNRSGIAEFLLGSTAHTMLQRSHIPLFIIPSHHE
jgi:nucleotide-binding universal stress UspA family protein